MLTTTRKMVAATKRTLILASQRVAKVAICLCPEMARLMTYTQAGMHPKRPMLTMHTLGWEHSSVAHG